MYNNKKLTERHIMMASIFNALYIINILISIIIIGYAYLCVLRESNKIGVNS